MSSNEDRTLICADCGNSFTWSAREQEFFREMGFSNPPKRCRQCRQAKKERQGGGGRKGDGK